MILTGQMPDLNTVLELLQSDRPTTFMLEAIVKTKLSVRVFQQEFCDASGLGRTDALQHLQSQPDDSVLYRHSGLFTSDGLQVSENQVTATSDLPSEVLEQLQAGRVPIIHILEKFNLNRKRILLSFGKKQVCFAGQEVFACYKEYLICAEDRPIMHLQEVFAPTLIQLGLTV